MTVKIPTFIVKIVNTVAKIFERHDSQESINQRMGNTVVQETYDDLVLCLKLYLWEEKAGVPHPHTLEEVSKVFRVKLKDIQTVYSILKIRYQVIDDIERALTQAYA